MNLYQTSLKVRLFAGMFVLLTSIFTGMSFFNYWEGKKIVMEQIFQAELPVFVDNVYFRVHNELQHSTALGYSLAQNDFIKEWFKNPDAKSILHLLANYEKTYEIGRATIVHDSLRKAYSGNLIFPMNAQIKRDSWYFEFRNQSESKNFNLYYDQNFKRLMFFVNHKIYAQDSTLLGVIGLGTNLDSLLKKSLSIKLPVKLNIMILDSKGVIKIQKNQQGKFFTGGTRNIGQIEGIKNISNDILRNKNGAFTYFNSEDKMFVNVRFLEDFNWYIVSEIAESEILRPTREILITNIVLAIVIIAGAAFGAYFYVDNITAPIVKLTYLAEQISEGKINQHFEHKPVALEIDRLAEAFRQMLENLQNIVSFAENIQKGKINTHFEAISQDDKLGQSLLTMQKSLQDTHHQNLQRNWVNEGLSKFSLMLRSQNLEATFDQFMQDLIKYLQANQGALFLLSTNKAYLELKACYAYERKKFLEKNIDIKDGLLGQTFLEKQTNYLRNIPQNYTHITSGLGEATPTSLLLVPISFNGISVGVIELASFNEFLPYQIELVEKIGETFASFVISLQANEKNTELLKETQLYSENLRSQEEEMRQNLEELMATQEEMSRKEKDYLEKIGNLEYEIRQLKKKLGIL